MKKINNKGISLIEILVVIALAAIVTGTTIFTLSVVDNGNVQKAARTYASGVDLARTITMAKGQVKGTMHVVQKADGWYYYIGDNASNVTQICKNKISVEGVSGDFNITFNGAGMVESIANNTIIFKNAGTKKACKVHVHSLTGKQEVESFYLP